MSEKFLTWKELVNGIFERGGWFSNGSIYYHNGELCVIPNFPSSSNDALYSSKLLEPKFNPNNVGAVCTFADILPGDRFIEEIDGDEVFIKMIDEYVIDDVVKLNCINEDRTVCKFIKPQTLVYLLV
jgi:hypothetical protein